MFPSFHEFKSEVTMQYDPYFPASSPPVNPVNMCDNPEPGYSTYQHQNGGYTQYSQPPQSWSGSSTGSQPSPGHAQNGNYTQYNSANNWSGSSSNGSQSSPPAQPHNTFYGPGPGPVDGGGPPPTPNAQNGDYYASQQQPQQPQQQQQQQSYYHQPCNQYDQYNYQYNGQWHPPPGHPAPGSSPPLYPSYIKSEYTDLKPSPPPHAHPGAIQAGYYGNGGHHGNGSISPHSPHLLSMTPPNMMQQPQQGPPPEPWTSIPTPPPGHMTNGKRVHHQTKITDDFKVAKRPRSNNSAASKRASSRFNGMSEEEVAKRGLPDYLKPGLDIVFIGINPSMFAAYTGKYYDGPGNHFWQALYLSGILSEPMSAVDDHKLLDLGIGFTNIVPRTTRGLSDLSRKEIADGAEVLREKLCKFKPKIAVFNGKAIYEVYSGQKKFMFGRQPEPLNDGTTWLWVMPSSSARCAQLPRAVDKVPFFEALRKFRDYLNGRLPKIEDNEVVFANVSLRNWNNSAEGLKSDLEANHEEVNPNLQPFTDGVPANVPQSVSEVIEDVVRMYRPHELCAVKNEDSTSAPSGSEHENSLGSNAQ